jgi:hypothetical protein
MWLRHLNKRPTTEGRWATPHVKILFTSHSRAVLFVFLLAVFLLEIE